MFVVLWRGEVITYGLQYPLDIKSIMMHFKKSKIKFELKWLIKDNKNDILR